MLDSVYDRLIAELKAERAKIDEEISTYFHKRNVLRSMEIEEPLVEIKYPEPNETGYVTSTEVITTGQLRLEQAIARVMPTKFAAENGYFKLKGEASVNHSLGGEKISLKNYYECSKIVWSLEND